MHIELNAVLNQGSLLHDLRKLFVYSIPFYTHNLCKGQVLSNFRRLNRWTVGDGIEVVAVLGRLRVTY